MMLTEVLTDLCGELRNWFDHDKRYFGTFTITNGELAAPGVPLKPGQYYRVLGSTFHDGVHQYQSGEEDAAADETFEGAVWLMFIPPAAARLAADIAAWREQYEAAVTSPYTQESVVGLYSYTKGALNGSSGNATTWQSVFAERMNAWRKL